LNNKVSIIHEHAIFIGDYENNQSEEVANAIRDISKSIDDVSKIRNVYLKKLIEVDSTAFVRDLHNEATALKFYYDTIHHLLEEMRSTLIPRALQLSSDQKVNEALLEFEEHIRIFEDGMRSQQTFDHKIPNLRSSIAPFLKEAGILYDTIQHELQNSPKV